LGLFRLAAGRLRVLLLAEFRRGAARWGFFVLFGVGRVRARAGPIERRLCGRDAATEARRRGRVSGRRVEVTPLTRRCRARAGARTARPDEEDGAGWVSRSASNSRAGLFFAKRAGNFSKPQIQFFDGAVAISEAGVEFAFAKGEDVGADLEVLLVVGGNAF